METYNNKEIKLDTSSESLNLKSSMVGILNRLRQQLLDLTGTNRLINFRYTKRRSLRFVDTEINKPYELLLKDRIIPLQYVPLPKNTEDGQLTAIEHAARLGIDISYDLNNNFNSKEQLQTLLFPKELDYALRALSAETRLAMEEAGNHILFLTGGFLQFTNLDVKQTSSYIAPLLFLPVSLQRGDIDPSSGMFTYMLKFFDDGEEGIRENVTLREKLRTEFGFQLPNYESGQTPTEYLNKVTEACEQQRGWKILHHLTLTVLSFKRLALWADLDVQRNPQLLDHPLIRKLLGVDNQEEYNEIGVEEYSIDDHPLAELPLICDADSSQHSAIIDALNGKNLVIEGPPGTGKSQTITNLIATAISRGKSVLFIADKKAALDVVFRRLDSVGLGAFCLELHSNKSCKKAVLKSIKDRLEKTFSTPLTSDDLMTLRNHRDKLNSYARIMKEPSGLPCNDTIHDVLWKVELKGNLLGEHLSSVKNLIWKEAPQWNCEDLYRRKDALKQIEIYYSDIKEFSSHHAWWGFIPRELSLMDQDQIEEFLTTLEHHLNDLVETAKLLNNLLSKTDLKNLDWIVTANQINTLSPPKDINISFFNTLIKKTNSQSEKTMLCANILEKILEAESYKSILERISLNKHPILERVLEIPNHLREWPITKFTHCIETLTNATNTKCNILPSCSLTDLEKFLPWSQTTEQQPILSFSVSELESLIKRFSMILDQAPIEAKCSSEVVPCLCDISEIARNISNVENSLAIFRSQRENLNHICTSLGLTGSHDRLPELLHRCSQIALSIPREEIFRLKTIPQRDSKSHFLAKEASAEQQYLLNEKEELGRIFRLNQLPSIETLENVLESLRNRSWWSIFTPDIITSKFLCKKLSLIPLTTDTAIDHLDRLIRWILRKDKFLHNSELIETFGSSFQGLETDWMSIRKVLDWIRDSSQQLTAIPQGISLDPVSWSETIIEQITTNRSLISELHRNYRYLCLEVSKIQGALPELQRAVDIVKTIALPQVSLLEVKEALKNKLACDAILEDFFPVSLLSNTWDQYFAILETHLQKLQRWLSAIEGLGTGSLTPQIILTALEAEQKLEHIQENLVQYCNSNIATSSEGNTKKVSFSLLQNTVEWCLQVLKLELPQEIQNALLNNPEKLNQFSSVVNRGKALYTKWQLSLTQLSEKWSVVDFVQDQKQTNSNLVDSIERARDRVYSALSNIDQLQSWLAYNRYRKEAESLELIDLIELVESRKLPVNKLISAFEHVYYRSCMKEIYTKFPLLNQYSGILLNNARKQFALLDRRLLQQNGDKIAREASKRPIPQGRCALQVRDLTDLELLKHEFPKERRHIPIRQLISRAGNAIQTLKPCFLMSPLSVSQYLDGDKLSFDMLIIDEASQMRVAEAFGSVVRAKQLIVVGDSKQLPPTRFFDQNLEVEDEEECISTVEDGVDSILDRCLQVFTRPRSLRWHYRSQHEDLISFSNYHFYENKLVVLPTALNQKGQMGVQMHYLPDAIYVEQSNREEAEKLIEGVIRQLLKEPLVSVGVVTLNQKQRDLIRDLFDQKLRDLSDLRKTVNLLEEQGVPFFIKNLENVQGDERDVIFISTVYGKASGSTIVRQTFGPINQAHGWRRLNVLFTRARQRIELFTSMQAEDLVINEESSRGVKTLREYLQFARDGALSRIDISIRECESPFETTVSEFLQRNGYEVQSQLGVEGYYIDLVVRNPERLSEFLAAIECDGATYHSSKSARDRDRIRQQLLENLGWKGKIWRIWSTDWFANRAKEGDKLLDFLAKLRCPNKHE